MTHKVIVLSKNCLRNIFLVTIALAAGIIFISCGDSSRGPEPDTNIAPLAMITMTPEVAVPGETVTLSGTGSSDPDAKTNDTLTYEWEQKSGSAVDLSDRNQAVTSFIVPEEETTIVIQLIVTDKEDKASIPATISIPVVIAHIDDAIFVSAGDGSDSGDGSAKNPLATISRAIALAKESGKSQTIYLAPGTYDETVSMESDITLVGGVSEIDENGQPVFADESEKTVIAAPGEDYAMKINNVSDATIKRIHFEGGTSDVCGDVIVTGSQNITLDGNEFSSENGCQKYTGLSVEDSEDVRIISSTGKTSFTLESGGMNDNLTAIRMVQSDKIEISNINVEGTGNFSETTLVTAIEIQDSGEVVVNSNSISISGGTQSTGVMVKCSESPVTMSIEHNELHIDNASTKSSGIRMICKQENGSFDISGNLVAMKTKPNRPAIIRGIEASLLMRSGTLSAVNNVISMPPVTEPQDSASKAAIFLSKFGSGSKVDLLYNTLLVTGNLGFLYGISSDVPDLSFAVNSNIVLVYGSNAANAALSLPTACGTSSCVKPSVSNLMNGKVTNKDVAYIYYPDMKTKVEMSSAPSGNYVDNMMKPTYFNMESGELLSSHQSLAVNRGSLSAGVTTDINGKNRGLTPDVGAVEY